jgi:putative ABC transport system substrate-binding protein
MDRGTELTLEIRYGEGDADRLPGLAAELVRLRVDVIVTGSSSATKAAKDATRSIPIVMGASADALVEGFVTNSRVRAATSRARRSGRVGDREQATRIAAVGGGKIGSRRPARQSRERVAPDPRQGPRRFRAEVGNRAPRPSRRSDHVTFRMPSRRSPKVASAGMIVLTDSMFFGQRRSIVDLAAKAALPTMYSQREFAVAGGLASYGPSVVEMHRTGRVAGRQDPERRQPGRHSGSSRPPRSSS